MSFYEIQNLIYLHLIRNLYARDRNLKESKIKTFSQTICEKVF